MAKYDWYKDDPDKRFQEVMRSDFPQDFLMDDFGNIKPFPKTYEKDCLLWNDENYLNKVKVEIGKNDIYLEVNGDRTFVNYNSELVSVEQAKHLVEYCLDENIKEGQKLSVHDLVSDLKDGLNYYENEISAEQEAAFINKTTIEAEPPVPEDQNKIKTANEIGRKAGYIQGVCECVLAIGDDNFSAKKLLTEMNVTREMAKKYAKPETYKSLEQGIFAKQPKIEQKHTIKR